MQDKILNNDENVSVNGFIEIKFDKDTEIKLRAINHPDWPKPKRKINRWKKNKDKIFNNDYNEGNIELDFSQQISVDSNYNKDYLDDTKRPTSYNYNKKLLEKIYNYVSESNYSYIIDDPSYKVKKDDVKVLYVQMINDLDLKEFTYKDIFLTFAEATDAKIKTLWKNIPLAFQQQILEELQDSMGIFSNKEVQRLF